MHKRLSQMMQHIHLVMILVGIQIPAIGVNGQPLHGRVSRIEIVAHLWILASSLVSAKLGPRPSGNR